MLRDVLRPGERVPLLVGADDERVRAGKLPRLEPPVAEWREPHALFKKMDRVMHEPMLELVNALKRTPKAKDFVDPVQFANEEQRRSYHVVVKQPLELGRIHSYLMEDLRRPYVPDPRAAVTEERKRYQCAEELAHDVRLVFKNCFLANGVHAHVFRYGQELARRFEARLCERYREVERAREAPPCPLRTRCCLLLADLMRHPMTEWFRRRKDWEVEVDKGYLDSIRRRDASAIPMDLETVQSKLDGGEYGKNASDFHVGAFAQDVRQVWKNAIAYNSKDGGVEPETDRWVECDECNQWRLLEPNERMPAEHERWVCRECNPAGKRVGPKRPLIHTNLSIMAELVQRMFEERLRDLVDTCRYEEGVTEEAEGRAAQSSMAAGRRSWQRTPTLEAAEEPLEVVEVVEVVAEPAASAAAGGGGEEGAGEGGGGGGGKEVPVDFKHRCAVRRQRRGQARDGAVREHWSPLARGSADLASYAETLRVEAVVRASRPAERMVSGRRRR